MLVGRERELEVMGALLDEARGSAGRGLLLTGEPGIGKTTLLATARELAQDMRVIEVVGIEAEADLPFSALGEIAAPLMDGLPELPGPQAEAIQGALAIGPGPAGGADRLATCNALLGLLRAEAERQPVLVLIDDAQWIDPASAECAGFAARRLQGARVTVLAAARQEPAGQPLELQLPVVEVGALAPPDARSLVESSEGDLAAATVDDLLDAAAGNPLALVELPSMLSDEQRRGLVPMDPVPVPHNGLRVAYERRIAVLSPEARAATVVAAASIDQGMATVVEACGDLGLERSALEEAERAEVLRLGRRRLEFAHPLLRGVVYDAAAGAERRRAHAALAAHAVEDARAWHLASAALGPNSEAAAGLDGAAARASARGAHRTAADALERAAELSGEPAAAAGRVLAAALAAAVGGAFERAAALLEGIADAEDPVLRAGARHLLAMVTLTGGIRNAVENHRMLTEEADRVLSLSAEMAAGMHADAGVIAVVAGRCDLALQSAGRAAEVLPSSASSTERCHVASIQGMSLVLTGRISEGAEALERAGGLLPEVEPTSPAAQSISFAMHGRLCVGLASTLAEEVLGLGRAARESGAQGVVPYYLLVAADAAFRNGDWAACERDIEEAVAIAEHSGQDGPLSIALVVRARLGAARGDEAAARADALRGIEVAAPPGYASTELWARAALGFLELSLGNTAEAIAELEETERLARAAGLLDTVIVPWAPDLVLAYVRARRGEDAGRVAAAVAVQGEGGATAIAAALAARCRGLAAVEDFDAYFESALALHEEAGWPFERARTLLAWGTRLHRANRRVKARELIREARDGFRELGASPWAERAEADLRAAGGVEREAVTDPDVLTAQEIRVARAIAAGATNREVAEQLFLSPKTIEFHLGRAYGKLGIHSRTELATLVAEGVLKPPSA